MLIEKDGKCQNGHELKEHGFWSRSAEKYTYCKACNNADRPAVAVKRKIQNSE